MNDLLFTILLLVGLGGCIFATGWTAHRIFAWIGNRLPWRKPPSWAVGSSLPGAPLWAVDPCLASYRRALREWGTTITATGEEAGRYVNELLFKIDPAVAGVSELMTASGEAVFTPGLRCMIVIEDGLITVLDREQQRGIRLEVARHGDYVLVRLEGTSLRVRLFQRTGSEGDPANGQHYSERLFSVELHSEAGLEVVPAGWPGGIVLLPSRPR